MGRQLNIRSDRAYEIAAALARKEGRSITAVVEEALAAYQHAHEKPDERLARWQALLEEDWKDLNESAFTVEDLYDPDTGLPA